MQDVLLFYPYLNKKFKYHLDASDTQLWAVTIQNVKPYFTIVN